MEDHHQAADIVVKLDKRFRPRIDQLKGFYKDRNMDRYQQALSLLRTDVFKNLPALKHMIHYKEHLHLIVDRRDQEWIVLAIFPSKELAHDALLYPESKWTVFLSNSDSALKMDYVRYLPAENCVVKTYDHEIEKDIALRFKKEKCRTLLSFSTDRVDSDRIRQDVIRSTQLTKELVRMFHPYSRKELLTYFNVGARWFGVRYNGKIVSGCFTFPNYENIWEIAGVCTLRAHRRKGYAEAVVVQALQSILQAERIPRYQAISTNTESIKLAEKIGMKLFLTLNHFEIKKLGVKS